MKILINCPGSFSHGLDSPERGEGRWSQNLARLLGQAGYQIFATSAGSPKSIGKGRPAPGVHLVTAADAKKCGPYDMYFDASWWEGKRALAPAKAYFHVAWTLEKRLRDPHFSKNHYIVYPYNVSRPKFINEKNPHPERTFFLPTPFGTELAEPAFNKKGILWPTRDAHQRNKTGSVTAAIDVINEWLDKDPNLHVNWMFWEQLDKYKEISRKIRKRRANDRYIPISPFNTVIKAVRRSKISVPIELPSCVPDCVVAGVAPVTWERGSWDIQKEVARKHGISIERDAKKARIREVIDTLMTDEKIYTEYVKDLQHAFRHHTEAESLKCFKAIVSAVFKG